MYFLQPSSFGEVQAIAFYHLFPSNAAYFLRNCLKIGVSSNFFEINQFDRRFVVSRYELVLDLLYELSIIAATLAGSKFSNLPAMKSPPDPIRTIPQFGNPYPRIRGERKPFLCITIIITINHPRNLRNAADEIIKNKLIRGQYFFHPLFLSLSLSHHISTFRYVRVCIRIDRYHEIILYVRAIIPRSDPLDHRIERRYQPSRLH